MTDVCFVFVFIIVNLLKNVPVRWSFGEQQHAKHITNMSTQADLLKTQGDGKSIGCICRMLV